MAARRLADLPREERVRVVTRATLRVVVVTTLLLVGYAVAPLGARFSTGTVIWVAVLIVGFAAVVVVQVRAILRADYPQIRAVAALAFIVVLFLVAFALTYAAMSASDSDHFSEPLSRVDAMYLTITIFATVGFGDITPITATARLLASVQMLLDLVVLGLVVRVLFTASQEGLRRGTSD